MALDEHLRQVKEVTLLPFCRIAARFATPTQLTLVGFVFGLLAPVCIIWQFYVLANFLWWINRFFDGIDGVVARLSNRQSDFGGYIDILCDFTIYSLIPISLVVAEPSEQSYLIVALLEGSFFMNAASQLYLGSLLEKRSLNSSRFTLD